MIHKRFVIGAISLISLPVAAQHLQPDNPWISDVGSNTGTISIICPSPEPAAINTPPVTLLKWNWERLAEARHVDEGIMRSELASRLPQKSGMRQAADRIAAEAAQMTAIESALAKLQEKK